MAVKDSESTGEMGQLTFQEPLGAERTDPRTWEVVLEQKVPPSAGYFIRFSQSQVFASY